MTVIGLSASPQLVGLPRDAEEMTGARVGARHARRLAFASDRAVGQGFAVVEVRLARLSCDSWQILTAFAAPEGCQPSRGDECKPLMTHHWVKAEDHSGR
jgi:hypothetical protein